MVKRADEWSKHTSTKVVLKVLRLLGILIINVSRIIVLFLNELSLSVGEEEVF